MAPSNSTDEVTARVTLDPALNAAAAGPLYKSLSEFKHGDVLVDASLVRHLGAQCLAILLSAHDSWKREDRSFRIAGASENFRETLGLLGIAEDRLSLNGEG